MRNRGVTLIEIMVVVAIAGVMATIAVVSMDGTTIRANRQGDVILVEDALKRARNLARNARRCVQVEPAGDIVRTTMFDTCTPLSGPQTPIELKLPFAKVCPFDSGDGTLVYTPSGSIQDEVKRTMRIVPDACTDPAVATLKVQAITGTTKRVKGEG